MAEVLEFKKKFLYKNEKGIEENLKLYEEWRVYLENGLIEAQKLFETPLTAKEKKVILSDGWAGVEQLLREKSQYPKAKVETILDLNGLDGTAAKEALKHAPKRFAAVGYSISANGLKLNDSVRQRAIDGHTYFTQNDKQNDALAIADELADNIELAIKKGIISELDRTKIAQALSSILLPGLVDGQRQLVPDTEKIRQIS